MIMTGIGVFSLPLLLIFSSLAAVPLAGPPLPLDPALSAVAPPDCIWYASSAGVAEADPDSSNQTEQLFAEPEVRHFSDQLQKQLIGAVRRSTGTRREQSVLATEIPKLILALMHRPLAAFVEDFQVTEDAFGMQAGLVLSAGDQRVKIEQAISQLVEFALEGGVPIGSINRDGETWSMLAEI